MGSDPLDKREVVSFRKTIAAGTSDTLVERVKAAGTIEEIRVKFYLGQTGDLRVRPFVEHKGRKIEDVITYPSTANPYLSGEDDYFVFPISISVGYDDYIKVWVQNVDAVNSYTLVVDYVIDYLGGKNRVV